MSWQSYVDDQLVGAGLAKGAIIGISDGSTWASSADFNIGSGEGQTLVELFQNPPSVFANGINLEGVRYLGIKGDERSIYGKSGSSGVITVKTGQTIVIGVYNENMQPGKAATTVEKLGDYLIENGY